MSSKRVLPTVARFLALPATSAMLTPASRAHSSRFSYRYLAVSEKVVKTSAFRFGRPSLSLGASSTFSVSTRLSSLSLPSRSGVTVRACSRIARKLSRSLRRSRWSLRTSRLSSPYEALPWPSVNSSSSSSLNPMPNWCLPSPVASQRSMRASTSSIFAMIRSMVSANESTELSRRLSRLTRIMPISHFSRSRWSKLSFFRSSSRSVGSVTYWDGM